MNFRLIKIITPFFILILSISCVKKSVSTTSAYNNKPDAHEDKLEKIYLKEGFISSNLFRIVIVDSIDKNNKSFDELTRTAEKRALSSLRKYLLENDIIYTNNTRAELINLIQNYSSFTRQSIKCNDSNIYYLDIKKRDIKGYIDSLSRTR